jgi:predicted metal-dependent phosphoesterase TrpH
VTRAAAAGLGAIALTDHDTLDGLPGALAAGAGAGIRVVPGCEFSVAAPWGEMHLLGYFLPVGWDPLEEFLAECRADRGRRGAEMVSKLQRLGVAVDLEDVVAETRGGALGRPHVARALVRRQVVPTVQDAFDRYIGWGRPGFVEKRLPAFRAVAELVHSCGGVVSAAHLRERGTRAVLATLKSEGLDAVETRHPVHDADVRSRLSDHALALGLLRTGGSDWHGDSPGMVPGAELGGQRIPAEWLVELERARPADHQSSRPPEI